MQHKLFRLLASLTLVLALTLTETSVAFASAFTVNSATDAVDVNPGDGICASAIGECTLRAAIQEANALPGDDDITLPTGSYTLTIAGTSEDAATTGDLDITDNLTINGAGSAIIDGNGNVLSDRVFHITGDFNVNISGVTIRGGNIVSDEGGGIFIAGGATVTLTNSTVSGNATSANGGGIRTDSGVALTLNNSTISNNSASGGVGGGIFSAGVLTLNNSTISGNTALFGGGIYNFPSFTATLYNTIVANSPSGGNCDGTITDGGGNLSWPDSTCPGINADPILGPLTNNGGSTETHALLAGSAAIDAAVDENCPATDQRGISRPQGLGCDIGAFELEAFTVNGTADTVDANPGDSVCDTGTGECTLRAAIQEANALPGDDTISLPSGTYTLALSGANEDSAATGDLDISSNIVIIGEQNASAIIDGNALDRVIQIVDTSTFVRMFNVTIQNGNSPDNGGGIVNAGTLLLNNSIVRNNFADCTGSAIYNTGGFASSNSIIQENIGGGGVSCVGVAMMNTSAASMNLYNTVISNNQPGGGLYNNGGIVFLNSSTIRDNVGGGVGDTPGGIYNFSGYMYVNNSTISGNSTASGGGIFTGGGGDIILANATITANSADLGGGIYNFPDSPSNVYMRDTILAGNLAISNGPDCVGTVISSGFNLVGNDGDCAFYGATGDQVGTSVSPIDSLLAPLQNNGGFTETHALLAGSPAIDMGNPGGCQDADGNLVTIDQRGISRPQGAHCDIGAFEREQTVPPPANDNFANASVISTLPFNGAVNNTVATTELNEPYDDCAFTFKTIWYSFIPGANMMVRADTAGSSFANSQIKVYLDTGSGIGGLSFLACAESGNPATLNLQAGATYYFQAGSMSFESGDLLLNLQEVFPPQNDNFTSAEPISLPFNATADITDATNEPGEPAVCASLDKSVWYSFMPAKTMLVTTYIQENIGFSIINVYRGNGGGMDSLSFLTCQGNNSPYTFLAIAGQTYYLQVGTIPGFDGTIQVNLAQVPAPVNDEFEDAINIGPTPVLTNFDISGATLEDSEPTPTCLFGSPFFESVWYMFTPSENASLSATLSPASFSPVMAVYSGTSFNDLTALGCGRSGNTITFQAVIGRTYFFQIGSFFPELGSGSFLLETTPPPEASFYYYPGDPSKFDTVQFQDNSDDPGNIGIQTYSWNFGDGTVASGYSATHKYASDGDYQVVHTVTTTDGRTAAITQTVQVRTHDVAITKIAVPASANVGQTKTITVTLRNIAYPETVQVDLYKSTPNGFVWIATVTKSIPALSGNRTTAVNFNYTFTSDDAKLGKVTFKAVATIVGARDAYPADNEKISSITKVAR